MSCFMLKLKKYGLHLHPILLSAFSPFNKSSYGEDWPPDQDDPPTQIIVSLDLTTDGESPLSLQEFYRRLNAELLKETKQLRHPIAFYISYSIFNGSRERKFLLEKSYVIKNYDLVGVAQFRKKVGDWLDTKSTEVTVGRSGHHGSVHSAFVNGSIGAALTGLYAGIFSKGIKPLDWQNPSAPITLRQHILPRVFRRMFLFLSLCYIGGHGIDYSSQILEIHRKENDEWNQIAGSAIIGAIISLVANRRGFKKAIGSAVLFSSLTAIHYRMDMVAAGSKGVTNSQFYY